jgi:polyisoprenyl-teichoic acid--peptidoglycan teichoic acid transferase
MGRSERHGISPVGDGPRVRLPPAVSFESRGGRPIRSPGVAAFLSFLWPGLGQWYAGGRRNALVFAFPVLVVLVVVITWLLQGPESVVIQLFSPGTALTIVVLVGLLAVWRIVSMVDAAAGLAKRPIWRRRGLSAGLAVMISLVLISHAAVANVAWSFYQAGSKIFPTAADAQVTPPPDSSDNVAVMPVATPVATPQTASSRINVLFLGIDSSERRTHALTDTLLVVSVDPATGSAAMISFPRDIADFPLYSGGIYHGKINALMTDADKNHAKYPDGGVTTLTKELGFLLGVPIHYYAAINLDGFEAMVDRVGGVTITNESAIDDPNYGGWKQPGKIGFRLSAGKHTLDGANALAYVRSRKGNGNNDFERARRQQQLLIALEKKLSDPSMLPKIPQLLDDATRTITTSFPPDRLSEMLTLGRSIDDKNITRKVLGPPYALRDTKAADYRLVIVPAKIAELSISLFGNESRYATATGAAAP